MPQLYPVIHHHDIPTTLANAAIAVDAGCPGVFLIDMQGRPDTLWPAADALRRQHPHLWLGVNRLDLDADVAVTAAAATGLFDGVWTDDAGLHSVHGNTSLTARLARAMEAWRAHRPAARLYAAVAFKGHAFEPDPGRMTALAVGHGWVPTTSGSHTGSAPAVAHLEALARVTRQDGGRLAVASGITPENASVLGVWCDDVLAATGISADFHHFAPARVAALQAVLTGLDA